LQYNMGVVLGDKGPGDSADSYITVHNKYKEIIAFPEGTTTVSFLMFAILISRLGSKSCGSRNPITPAAEC
jgi:hypothetical protein